MNPDALLVNLNSSQHAAVSSLADTLAILAGPGSGKTHTLTSRTAWLLARGLQPWNIIVATFTVKAARDMKERIGKLLGNGLESKLVLGTFHSIARRYLARYGHLIGIRKDFGIADSADSLAIIKRIVKRNNFNIDPKVARSRISGLKARGKNTESEKNKSGMKAVEAQEFQKCFAEYESALQRSNLLDYDDLLLQCVELLRSHPSCVSNVEAVLIDEFQDTNIVQFDLMRLFAAEKKRITIVGDPDQSIYGFRAAEIKNYKRMLHQYPDTVTIALEENYRSSGTILMTALNVIEQDNSRVAKSLLPTHTVGTRPVLRRLAGAYKEAEWIAMEIQRCLGMTGALLDLNDFAILLRSAALSRLIETALGKAGIAYRMVGGLRFYDRVEVKTLLDYLRVINQPSNNDALARIINNPPRRIGDTTIKALLEEADKLKITLWALILGVVQGKRTPTTKIQKAADSGLSKLVDLILTAQKKMAGPKEKASTVDLMKYILEKTEYEKWLEEHHEDTHKARWDNIQELITQATDFQDLLSCGYEDEALPEIEGLEQEDTEDHLSRFLANVALASEVKSEEGVATAQVTISTIHAAKGLEWPVVFIPATYQGSIPHSRAEDSDEERRLLYVAMTRAKVLLYMSYPLKNSQNEDTTLSPFLNSNSLFSLLDRKGPSLKPSTVQSISYILRRDSPSLASIQESSSSLKSIEDDLFPLDGKTDDEDRESRWESATAGNISYNMGQQAPKRRKVEIGRSVSNQELVSGVNWKPTYTTTMQKATSFTSARFVTAGSHYEVLKEQSTNYATTSTKDESSNLPQKLGAKKKVKALEGQGNLLAFLGKSEAQIELPEPKITPQFPQIPTYNFNHSRSVTSINSQSYTTSISPELSNHPLGPSKTTAFSRPSRTTHLEATQSQAQPHPQNNYIFLSSSPERNRAPPPEVFPVLVKAGLVAKPDLSRIRPALSMHKTTIERLSEKQKGEGQGVRKTLGVRRMMGEGSGWRSGGGGKFVVPNVKRPSE